MIFRLFRSVDCNVAVSKSQHERKIDFFLNHNWRKYRINERYMVVKRLKRASASETLKSLSVISDSVEEQTDFSYFLSTVVLLNRPRSHWGRFWKLDRSEIRLARNSSFVRNPTGPRPSQRPRSLIDEAEGEIWSNPIIACQECDRRWKSACSK